MAIQLLEREVSYLKKSLLIYGTYNRKEWDRIVAIYNENNVEFTEEEHVHVFTLMEEGRLNKYEWRFYRLVSYVMPEEERIIRRKRNLLKKLYY